MVGLLLLGGPLHAACPWPAWTQFKQDYLREDGRVVDPSDPRKITTSEGQSYALFFALVANDRAVFGRILRWTENNLSAGSLRARLPGWLWGKRADGQWALIDDNPASDADVWIAWVLLEAGRLWDEPDFTRTGEALVRRIAQEEVAVLPGIGAMLLPGARGFSEPARWRLNPSYLPPQVIRRFTAYGAPWDAIYQQLGQFLPSVSPLGFAPDWVIWDARKGWQPAEPVPDQGSYNAIRVYLWVGMMHEDDPLSARLRQHFAPMARLTARRGIPPESLDTYKAEPTGNGPVGFSAALLPLLAHTDPQALAVQRARVEHNFPGADAYYSYVLTLFGQGWDQRRFRFTSGGELTPDWGRICENSQ